MRNLKRVLTMFMAVAMMLGMMVVGAGATSFTDDKDIVNKAAVEKMSSLNIIKGYEDGTFKPTGTIKRGEAVKMIVIALNGGNDPKLDSSAVVTATFTDTVDHWARGYIEYGVNFGFVAGLGDNTFGPEQELTGTALAKMCLVALEYDPVYEKFSNDPTWALNINQLGMQKGLYEVLQHIDPNAPISRDNAAQMIANFVDTKMVEYKFGFTGNTSGAVSGEKKAVDTADTILSKYYKLVPTSGTITGVSYDSKRKEYSYELNNSGNYSYNTTVDFSKFFGAKVEILWKNKDNQGTYNRAEDSVYDINLDGSVIFGTGIMDDFGKYDTSKKTLVFQDKTFDTDTTIDTVLNIAGTAGPANVTSDSSGYATIAGLTGPYDVSLIDTDDNGKLDRVVYTPFVVNKVAYVGTTNATFSVAGSKELKDITVYEGMAKNDIVAYYAAANTPTNAETAKKLEIKTATITATKGAAPNEKYQVDGVWCSNATTTSLSVNDKIEYVAVGSIIYYAKVVEYSATSKDILVVYNATGATGSFAVGADAKVMLADGSKKNVNITKIDTTEFAGSSAAGIQIGEMYTYKVTTAGKYEISTLAKPGNLAGHDEVYPLSGATSDDTVAFTNRAYKAADKTLLGRDLADDANVFVVDRDAGDTTADPKVKLYSGKEIKNNGVDLYATAAIAGNAGATALTVKADGYEKVKTAVIFGENGLPSITQGTNYGYLTADAARVNNGGTQFLEYTIWTANGELKAREETTDNGNALKKGTTITFDNVGEKEGVKFIKNVTVPAATTSVVTGYTDGSKDVAIGGVTYKISTDDTTILYVTSNDAKGVADSGIIRIGDDKNADGTADWNNVRFIAANDRTLQLLIVDVDNDMKGAPITYVNAAAINTNAKLQAAFANYDTITVTDALTLSANLTVPANKTLILNNALTTTGQVLTVNGSAIVYGAVTTAANEIAVGSTGDLTLDVVAPATTYEAILASNGAMLTVKESSSNAANATTWYKTTGIAATGNPAAGGTAATAFGTTDRVAAGTYVFGTYGFAGGAATAASLGGWFVYPMVP